MIQESDRNLVMDNVKTRFQLILSVANHNVTKNLTGKLILCKKKPPKIAFFGVHESGLPDFGRPWTANG